MEITDNIPEDAVVMCVPKGTETPFKDNVEGLCSDCGCVVVFRPYIPKDVKKLCTGCGLIAMAEQAEVGVLATKQGAEEFAALHGKDAADKAVANIQALVNLKRLLDRSEYR